jgi:hypothetical protein
MLEAADGDLIAELRRQASMPIAESGMSAAEQAPFHEVVERSGGEARARAIDWIRFGYLLRTRLGWDDTYPDHPAET